MAKFATAAAAPESSQKETETVHTQKNADMGDCGLSSGPPNADNALSSEWEGVRSSLRAATGEPQPLATEGTADFGCSTDDDVSNASATEIAREQCLQECDKFLNDISHNTGGSLWELQLTECFQEHTDPASEDFAQEVADIVSTQRHADIVEKDLALREILDPAAARGGRVAGPPEGVPTPIQIRGHNVSGTIPYPPADNDSNASASDSAHEQGLETVDVGRNVSSTVLYPPADQRDRNRARAMPTGVRYIP
jgi:hypothetical protein